jgi:hypothetical protein
MAFFKNFSTVYVVRRSFYFTIFFLAKSESKGDYDVNFPLKVTKIQCIISFSAISKKRDYRLFVESLYGSLFWEYDKDEFTLLNFTNFTFNVIPFFHLHPLLVSIQTPISQLRPYSYRSAFMTDHLYDPALLAFEG